MATTLEYIILCRTPIQQAGQQIAAITIMSDSFILKDSAGKVLHTAARQDVGGSIFSGPIPELSFGEGFRFYPAESGMFVMNGEAGGSPLECEVITPDN